MANKKGPLGRAADRIKAFFGIKSKESLERIADAAAAVPKTQGRIADTALARVYKQQQIQDAKEIIDAKEIDELRNAALELKQEGDFLLSELKENRNSSELDKKYYAFNKSVDKLVKKIESKQSVNTLPKLGYTNMQNVIPNLAELDYIKRKIILQMYELINTKNNASLNKNELHPRNLSAGSIKDSDSSSGTIPNSVQSTTKDYLEVIFQPIKQHGDDNKTFDQVFYEFNQYISKIQQPAQLKANNMISSISSDFNLRDYGEELKKYAVKYLEAYKHTDMKRGVEIIIDLSDIRVSRLGIYSAKTEKRIASLKIDLEEFVSNNNLSPIEFEPLQKALTAILLWQESNKGIETFNKKYKETIQYTPFIKNPHKNQP